MEGAVERKKIIGGNWKCNGTVQSIRELVTNVLNKIQFSPDRVEVFVAPISIHIASVKALLNKTIRVASQNMNHSG